MNDKTIVRISYKTAEGKPGFRYRDSENSAKKLETRLQARGATNIEILFRGNYENGKYLWY